MCSGHIHLVQRLHPDMKPACCSVVQQAAPESNLLTVSQLMLLSPNAQLPVQTEEHRNQTTQNI